MAKNGVCCSCGYDDDDEDLDLMNAPDLECDESEEEGGVMRRTIESVDAEVRASAPLVDRLRQCRERIGRMCSELRPPKMSIPVQWDDDDEFISTTIQDAIEEREKYAALLAAVDVVLDLSRRDLICDDEGTYTVDFVEAVDALREAREKVRV